MYTFLGEERKDSQIGCYWEIPVEINVTFMVYKQQGKDELMFA